MAELILSVALALVTTAIAIGLPAVVLWQDAHRAPELRRWDIVAGAHRALGRIQPAPPPPEEREDRAA